MQCLAVPVYLRNGLYALRSPGDGDDVSGKNHTQVSDRLRVTVTPAAIAGADPP